MIETIARYIIPAAYGVLPGRLGSPEATALLLAIGMQESRFLHRQQLGGPARGFWQFEEGGGVRGVLTHPASQEKALIAADILGYDTLQVSEAYRIIEHNDVLAAVFARLLLFTSPAPLPALTDAAGAWRYYVSCWRPGKPHPDTWAGFHAHAANLVQGARSGPPTPLRA